MTRRKQTLLSLIVGVLILAPVLAPRADAAPSINISQTIAGVGTFTGQFTIQRFVNQGGTLTAVGNLTGQLVDLAGNLIRNVSIGNIRIPVLTTTRATCPILHLELGPLDLDLLGVVIHLDKVVLDITAVPGPGNLLGNLLCQIAGLLDGGSPLTSLSGLLNQVLQLLG